MQGTQEDVHRRNMDHRRGEHVYPDDTEELKQHSQGEGNLKKCGETHWANTESAVNMESLDSYS